MAITRKVSSGIEITEARRDEDVFPCSLPLQEGTSRLEGWRSHEGFPNATKAHPILRAKPTKDNGAFLMVSFFSTPEMASSKTTSQAPRRRSPGLFTIFHEEVTGTPTKPTRRSPSKSNKLTVSHSNKSWWRAQHNAMMQSKNTRGVQILHTQIPPKQQMLG